MARTAVLLTPEQIAEKWNKRTKAAVPDAVAGVNAVTSSPMEKAAAQQTKMLQKLTDAVTSGKWKARLTSVSLADWKAKTAQKMQERMSGGVDAAMAKRLKFDKANVQAINEILPGLEKMPDLTLDDSINRATYFIRERAKRPYNG